jgi:hypothetical protein
VFSETLGEGSPFRAVYLDDIGSPKAQRIAAQIIRRQEPWRRFPPSVRLMLPNNDTEPDDTAEATIGFDDIEGEHETWQLLCWPLPVRCKLFAPTSRNFVYDAAECRAFETETQLFISLQSLQVARPRHESWCTLDQLDAPEDVHLHLMGFGFFVEPKDALPGKEKRRFAAVAFDHDAALWQVYYNLEHLPRALQHQDCGQDDISGDFCPAVTPTWPGCNPSLAALQYLLEFDAKPSAVASIVTASPQKRRARSPAARRVKAKRQRTEQVLFAAQITPHLIMQKSGSESASSAQTSEPGSPQADAEDSE